MAITQTTCVECGVPLTALRLRRRAVTCSARCAQVRQRRMSQQRRRPKRRGKDRDPRSVTPVKSIRPTKSKPAVIKRKSGPLQRQWQFVHRLSGAKDGVSVRQLADDAGVNLKTVRRDLIMLRQAGFRVVEEVGERGRKDWRITPIPVRIRSRKGLYRAMKQLLEQVLEHANRLGDQGIISRVRIVRDRVKRECR